MRFARIVETPPECDMGSIKLIQNNALVNKNKDIYP